MEDQPALSQEQITAFELIDEHPLLKKDPYAHRVVESNGIVDSGMVVDMGDFLAARAAYLEKENADEKLAAVQSKNSSAYQAAVMVQHSIRPDLEKDTE